MKEVKYNKLECYKFDKVIDLSSFSTIFVYTFKKGYFGIEEKHKQIELVVVNKGQFITYEDGVKYVLEAGETFLHKPYSVHHDECEQGNCQVSITSFLTTSESINELYDKKLTLTDDQYHSLNNIFSYARNNLSGSMQFWFTGQKPHLPSDLPYGFRQVIKNQLELFLISLLSEQNEVNKIDHSYKVSSLTKKIINLLKQNVYQKFDLEKIAHSLNYSKNYICRHFKLNVGCTILQFFYDLKIAEAKKLIMETDNSINQISDLLNFETVQYFSICFKKVAGSSPSTWKKNVIHNMFY